MRVDRSVMKKIIENYIKRLIIFYKNKLFFVSLFFSLVCVELAYKLTSLNGLIATISSNKNSLHDIVHDNIPRLDTSFIHAESTFIISDFRYYILFFFPRYILFTLKTLSLFILVRAIFINLTSLPTPLESYFIGSNFTFGGDLFFSGHVANTFLFGLVFYKRKPFFSAFFFIASFVLGFSAILGRYHYTVDVLAAPFFAFTIFSIAKVIFKQDYEMIDIDKMPTKKSTIISGVFLTIVILVAISSSYLFNKSLDNRVQNDNISGENKILKIKTGINFNLDHWYICSEKSYLDIEKYISCNLKEEIETKIKVNKVKLNSETEFNFDVFSIKKGSDLEMLNSIYFNNIILVNEKNIDESKDEEIYNCFDNLDILKDLNYYNLLRLSLVECSYGDSYYIRVSMINREVDRSTVIFIKDYRNQDLQKVRDFLLSLDF